jgi:hypothetical protein
MRILIIEDADFMALGLQEALSEQGHQVDWIIGVRSFEPFIGISNKKQNTAMDPSVYDIILCDGQLFGPNEGPAIVEQLAARGVTCVGISSTSELNKEMVTAGAVAGFIKVCAFAAIVEKILPMEAVAQMSPELIDSVHAFEQRIREDKELRRKLDGIITKFLAH